MERQDELRGVIEDLVEADPRLARDLLAALHHFGGCDAAARNSTYERGWNVGWFAGALHRELNVTGEM